MAESLSCSWCDQQFRPGEKRAAETEHDEPHVIYRTLLWHHLGVAQCLALAGPRRAEVLANLTEEAIVGPKPPFTAIDTANLRTALRDHWQEDREAEQRAEEKADVPDPEPDTELEGLPF